MPFDMEETPFDRFARLSMVAAALTGDLLPAEILGIVINQGTAGMGSQHAVAMLIQGDSLHALAAMGGGQDLARRHGTLPLDTPVPIAAAATRETAVFVPNRRALEADFPLLATNLPPGIEAVASLPLVASGRTYGAIGLMFEASHAFEPQERDFLKALADMAALALRPWAEAPEPGANGRRGYVPVEIGSVVAGEVEAALSVDADGRITRANRRLCELLGYERDELVGRPVEMLVPERLREAHAVLVRRYLADPTPRPYGSGLDIVARRADGAEVSVDVALSPVVGPEGVRVVAVIRFPAGAAQPDS